MELLSRALSNATAGPTLAPSTAAPSAFNSTFAPTSAAPESALAAFIGTSLARLIALVCASTATALSSWNIRGHLVHYTKPQEQKSIIRILVIVPVYAIFSFLTLLIPSRVVFFESFRDVWEAVVVYSFLTLMLEYCGGENSCLSVIMNHPGSITHPWPLNWCLPPIGLGSRFFRWCKRATLQFVIIKPIFVFLNLLFLSMGTFYDPTYQLVLSIVYNTSYTVALYSLLLFYKATHSHPGLVKRNPLYKFLAVKTVVFATYYQSLIIAIDAFGLTEEQSHSWNSFLLCCEMVIFAMLHAFSFSYKEYLLGPRSPQNSKSNGAAGGFDVSKNGDIELSNDSELAMRNARDVMSVTDVAKDAYYNFNSKYGSHVQLGTDNEAGMSPGPSTSLELQQDEQQSTSRPSHNMFANIGSTFKSIKTGGAVKDAMDEEGSATYGFDFSGQQATPSKEVTGADNDNPFIADYNDPLSIGAANPDEPKSGGEKDKNTGKEFDLSLHLESLRHRNNTVVEVLESADISWNRKRNDLFDPHADIGA